MAEEKDKAPESKVAVKIEIVQTTSGKLETNVFGENEVSFHQAVGMIEAAKSDLLHEMRKASQEPVVEIEIDELDLELNPDAKFEVGQKIPIRQSLVAAREKARKEALEKKDAEKK